MDGDDHTGSLRSHRPTIGICGTFDVANLGDLLFPIIAQAELSRRLGDMELIRFSYSAKSVPGWPFSTTALAELPKVIDRLHGLMIGGGHLVRFDKYVAPGYLPPSSDMHHPTSYWLGPILTALTHDCPVIWNAPSASEAFPRWAEPLLRLAVGHSRYVTVRDQSSKDALKPFAGGCEISVVPDTCFGVARLVDRNRPSQAFRDLRNHLALVGPYLVVQATADVEPFFQAVRANPDWFRKYHFVVVEIGPALQDRTSLITAEVPNLIHVRSWPDPLLLAELIGNSAGAVGLSLHLAITALSFGVPVFRTCGSATGKFALLSDFDLVHHLGDNRSGFLRFVSRLDRFETPPAVRAAVAQLDEHWDSIAEIVKRQERPTTRNDVAALCRAMPGWLENEFGLWQSQIEGLMRQIDDQHAIILERTRHIELQSAALTERDARVASDEAVLSQRSQEIASLREELARSRGELLIREDQIAGYQNSTSWRLTAPVRWIGIRRDRWQKQRKRNVLRFERLRQDVLASQPFQWGFVDGLFSRTKARALAASFPCDQFKTVNGYDGEKGFEYEARGLIHLGDNRPVFPEGLSPVWRQLVANLLAPEYREAMSTLTGRELASAPMEAYVCHYGPGAWLGPHLDLKEKIITHVFYFNPAWDDEDGGCLRILRSSKMEDMVAQVSPIVGNSSVLVRSENSWHAVSRVRQGCNQSRRSMNVIFYHPGAVSTMFPPGDATPMHRYQVRNEPPHR